MHFCVRSYDVEVVVGIDSMAQPPSTVDILTTNESISRSGLSTDRPLILETPDYPGENFTINPEFMRPLTQYLISTFGGTFPTPKCITAQETDTTSDARGSAMFKSLYENNAGVNYLRIQGHPRDHPEYHAKRGCKLDQYVSILTSLVTDRSTLEANFDSIDSATWEDARQALPTSPRHT